MKKEKFIVGLMKVGVPVSIILKMLTLTGCGKDPEPQGPQDKIILYTRNDLLETVHGGNSDAFDARLAGYRANPQIGTKTFKAPCQWMYSDNFWSEYKTSRLQRIKHKDPGRFVLGDTIRPYAIFINDKTWLEANGKTVIPRHLLQRQQ